MKKLFLFIFGIAFSAFTYGATLTPKMVMAHIDSKGTQSAREAYFSCWDAIKGVGYKLVENGSDDWLHIAGLLIKDSDGCYTQGLQTSIALAQINNAEKVLDLVDSENKLGAAYICIPFMADEVNHAKLRIQLSTLDRIESALKKVKAPKLREQKRKCLTYVRSSQEYIKESLSHSTN
jgi:hypothetical protein